MPPAIREKRGGRSVAGGRLIGARLLRGASWHSRCAMHPQHGLAAIDQFLAQAGGGFDADAIAKAVQPGAQVDVGGEGPAGQIELQGVGMAVAGGVGLQTMGRIRVMPPVVAGEGSGEAHLLDGIAGHPLAQKREGPGRGRDSQGLQHGGAAAG